MKLNHIFFSNLYSNLEPFITGGDKDDYFYIHTYFIYRFLSTYEITVEVITRNCVLEQMRGRTWATNCWMQVSISLPSAGHYFGEVFCWDFLMAFKNIFAYFLNLCFILLGSVLDIKTVISACLLLEVNFSLPIPQLSSFLFLQLRHHLWILDVHFVFIKPHPCLLCWVAANAQILTALVTM